MGPWMAMAVVVGTVIGSGVFKKPQAVAQNVPDFFWVAVVWITGGVLAFLGALALTEVAVLFPQAGQRSCTTGDPTPAAEATGITIGMGAATAACAAGTGGAGAGAAGSGDAMGGTGAVDASGSAAAPIAA